MKLYEITEDLRAVNELFEKAVDENGDPRDLTEEEKNFLSECLKCSQDDFEEKFDSMNKFMANLKLQSDNAEAERKNFKAELDRLSARSKVFANRRDSIKNYLFYTMQALDMAKYKSSLFSATIQQTPLSINNSGANLSKLPERFLKPREINSSAIKEAIKSGDIVVTDNGALFLDGEVIEGLTAERGTTLVIR